MKNAIKILLNTILFLSSLCVPAFSNADKYDKILARLESKKNLSAQHSALSTEKRKWVLTFEHERLPILDGVWTMNKRAVKRKELTLIKPKTGIYCNSRLPSYENLFEKEVVLSPQGQDFFVFKSLYPVSKDGYLDAPKIRNLEYQNYGFKGVIIPEEITYVYTLKLANPIENPNYQRQLWFQGRLFLENVSENKITGKGYENISTPECHGYVTDLIEFELTRKNYNELTYKN